MINFKKEAFMQRNEAIEMLKNLPEELKIIYGEKLKKVVLYGSVAREMATDDSDVDIMVLIDMNQNELIEYEDALSDVSTNLALEYFKVFSLIDVSLEEYDHWKDILPFYKNVDKEGIVLYAA